MARAIMLVVVSRGQWMRFANAMSAHRGGIRVASIDLAREERYAVS